jgi:hypothetical protein
MLPLLDQDTYGLGVSSFALVTLSSGRGKRKRCARIGGRKVDTFHAVIKADGKKIEYLTRREVYGIPYNWPDLNVPATRTIAPRS